MSFQRLPCHWPGFGSCLQLMSQGAEKQSRKLSATQREGSCTSLTVQIISHQLCELQHSIACPRENLLAVTSHAAWATALRTATSAAAAHDPAGVDGTGAGADGTDAGTVLPPTTLLPAAAAPSNGRSSSVDPQPDVRLYSRRTECPHDASAQRPDSLGKPGRLSPKSKRTPRPSKPSQRALPDPRGRIR